MEKRQNKYLRKGGERHERKVFRGRTCDADSWNFKIDDFEENSVEPTEELLEAIRILNDAQDKDYAQKCYIEQTVKLSEYELQKIYFEVIKELTREEHLPDMVIPMYVEKDLINKG